MLKKMKRRLIGKTGMKSFEFIEIRLRGKSKILQYSGSTVVWRRCGGRVWVARSAVVEEWFGRRFRKEEGLRTETAGEMECVLSGNQIKSLNRAVNCLYRVGSELLIEVLPDKGPNLRICMASLRGK